MEELNEKKKKKKLNQVKECLDFLHFHPFSLPLALSENHHQLARARNWDQETIIRPGSNAGKFSTTYNGEGMQQRVARGTNEWTNRIHETIIICWRSGMLMMLLLKWNGEARSTWGVIPLGDLIIPSSSLWCDCHIQSKCENIFAIILSNYFNWTHSINPQHQIIDDDDADDDGLHGDAVWERVAKITFTKQSPSLSAIHSHAAESWMSYMCIEWYCRSQHQDNNASHP